MEIKEKLDSNQMKAKEGEIKEIEAKEMESQEIEDDSDEPKTSTQLPMSKVKLVPAARSMTVLW